MIKNGKVYGNLIIEIIAVNEKRGERGTRNIKKLT